MILLMVSIIFIIISVIVMFRQRKEVREKEILKKDITAIFRPLDDIKKTLDSKKNAYTTLQESYQKELRQLRSDEDLLSLYELGVGTIDKDVYTKILSTRDLNKLELALTDVNNEIKDSLKNKTACICHYGNDIVVNNKRSEAKKLFNREIKLRLRCIDNDVKQAIALADWNNVNRLVSRIRRNYSEINSSGEIVKTIIQKNYLELKIRELRLSYEMAQLKADLKEEEREERRRIREAEREESKIKEAAEKAHTDRIRMEELIQQELAKLQDLNQEQRDLLDRYQKKLLELKEREKRAVSMAQLTRSGYVYVISNPLAFGESICKIGMTRRVNPNERVHELSGASVPDHFVVHGFVFSEDAPKLEKELHDMFSSERVNLVNKRKEFFSVNPDVVIEKINGLYPDLEISSEIINAEVS